MSGIHSPHSLFGSVHFSLDSSEIEEAFTGNGERFSQEFLDNTTRLGTFHVNDKLVYKNGEIKNEITGTSLDERAKVSFVLHKLKDILGQDKVSEKRVIEIIPLFERSVQTKASKKIKEYKTIPGKYTPVPVELKQDNSIKIDDTKFEFSQEVLYSELSQEEIDAKGGADVCLPKYFKAKMTISGSIEALENRSVNQMSITVDYTRLHRTEEGAINDQYFSEKEQLAEKKMKVVFLSSMILRITVITLLTLFLFLPNHGPFVGHTHFPALMLSVLSLNLTEIVIHTVFGQPNTKHKHEEKEGAERAWNKTETTSVEDKQ
jgi:hypothetical protein